MTDHAKAALDRWQLVEGLRQLADFIVDHPEVPVPSIHHVSYFIHRDIEHALIVRDALDEGHTTEAKDHKDFPARITGAFAGLSVWVYVGQEVANAQPVQPVQPNLPKVDPRLIP